MTCELCKGSHKIFNPGTSTGWSRCPDCTTADQCCKCWFTQGGKINTGPDGRCETCGQLPEAGATPPTVTNAQGGKQSYVSERLDLIPPECELLLGECLGFGANKYGDNNWQKITEQENLNHALIHIRKWQAGDRTEPHLVNAMARLNFATWHAIQSGEQPKHYNHPEVDHPNGQSQDAT